MIKKELHLFFTALMFYSRIPVPKTTSYSETDLNRATKYFPLLGIMVGCIVALVYWLAHFIFPNSLAIILSMVAGIFVTGSFHEDGFADVCDGFGGGWTAEDRLRIMKDSRIGTYGTVGLIFILLLKYISIGEFKPDQIPLVLILSHTLSRLMPVLVIRIGKYARNDATSKVKPLGKSITKAEFLIAILIGILPMVLFWNPYVLLVILLPLISTLWLSSYFEKRIGGYTGDCLGAIQQVSETGIYITLLLLLQFGLWS